MSVWKGTYSKLPHGFFDHALVLEAGEKAAMFLLRMSDFADRNETDGCLSDRQISTLGRAQNRRKSIATLHEVGLISRLEDDSGWRIEDWLDGHRSAAKLAEIRNARRSAGRKGGNARAKRQQDTEANAKQLANQVAEDLLNPVTVTGTVTQTETPPPTPSSNPPPLEDVAVVVADQLVETLGYIGDLSTAGERRYVARALGRGWTVEQLVDVAHEAASGDPTDVRQYLLGCLRKRANEDPPQGAPHAPTTQADWQADWAAVQSIVHSEGAAIDWRDYADQIGERCAAAAHHARNEIRYGTERDGMFSFRDNWVGRAVEA